MQILPFPNSRDVTIVIGRPQRRKTKTHKMLQPATFSCLAVHFKLLCCDGNLSDSLVKEQD